MLNNSDLAARRSRPPLEHPSGAAGVGHAEYSGGMRSRRADQIIYLFFTVQISIVVLLQRVAIPGLGIDISALLLPVSIVLFSTALGLRIGLSPVRAALYYVMTLLALISQLLVDTLSWSSLWLLIVSYLPIIFRIDVRSETYLRCMSFFQNLILLVCGIVVVQRLLQSTGWSLPSMDSMLPDWLIVPGYNYEQAVEWGSDQIKPNAFFFKEVSFVSQFIAVAFIIEATLFQRLHRLAIYLACLFATLAGTGLFLIALVLPVLIASLQLRRSVFVFGLVVCVVFVSIISGWYEQVANRVTEYESTDTSSYGRFVFPFVAVAEQFAKDPPIISGIGAGNVQYREDIAGVYVAPAKLIIEYGLVVAISFYVMLAVALFSGAPNITIATGLLVLFSLMGGYLLSPTIVYTMFLLGVFLRIPRRQTYGNGPSRSAKGARNSGKMKMARLQRRSVEGGTNKGQERDSELPVKHENGSDICDCSGGGEHH